VSAYTLAAGASGLLAATYLDKFDRKKLLLVLYTLFGVATLACGLAPDYLTLMAARVLAGVFGGVLSALAQTVVADVIPFDRRGRAMSIVMTVVLGGHGGRCAGRLVPGGAPELACAVLWHRGAGRPVVRTGAVDHLTRPDGSPATEGPTIGIRRHWPGPAGIPTMSKRLRSRRCWTFAGFTVIPFITIYRQTNVGWACGSGLLRLPCGGVATLFSARLVGVLTDRRGKVALFRVMAALAILPDDGHHVDGGPTHVGGFDRVHALLYLHERPHDPGHGHHRLVRQSSAARHLHGAQFFRRSRLVWGLPLLSAGKSSAVMPITSSGAYWLAGMGRAPSPAWPRWCW